MVGFEFLAPPTKVVHPSAWKVKSASWTSALRGSEKFTNSSLIVGPCATH